MGVIWRCKYRHPWISNEPITKACKTQPRTRLALCIQVGYQPCCLFQLRGTGGRSDSPGAFLLEKMYNGPSGWRTVCSRLSPTQPGQMSSIAPQEWWSSVDFTALSPDFFYHLASMWQRQQRPRSWNVIKVKRMSSLCCWTINDWPWESTLSKPGKRVSYWIWAVEAAASDIAVLFLRYHNECCFRTITETDQSRKEKLALLNVVQKSSTWTKNHDPFLNLNMCCLNLTKLQQKY